MGLTPISPRGNISPPRENSPLNKINLKLQKEERITFLVNLFNEITFFVCKKNGYENFKKKLFKELDNKRLFRAEDVALSELSQLPQKNLFLDIQWLYRRLKRTIKELAELRNDKLLILKFPQVYESPFFPEYFKTLSPLSNVIYATPKTLETLFLGGTSCANYHSLVLLRAVCNDKEILNSLAAYLPTTKINEVTLAMDGLSEAGDHELTPIFHQVFPVLEKLESLNKIGIACFQMDDEDAKVLAKWIESRPNNGWGYYCCIQEEYSITKLGWQTIVTALEKSNQFQINFYYDAKRSNESFAPLIQAAETNEWITVQATKF